ncbi:DNA polymerase I [Hyella patelloides LEGE 07179]|uniref:DNA polymerase I n=1 Tax=Hyella patelloides LEGE 07179 TaxID=945734 RepID=A0A563VJK9_9CYAN|nr:DNA polymerase I [Hyella patelloides]VEP11507.1 DNA polymerase I [Hyella patelloides LEGE 07179]
MSKTAPANHYNMDREKPVFILIDGHSLAFRAYYAFVYSRQGALRTSTGIPTSISFGFLNSLLQVIELEKPEYLAIAFDLPEPTFRHQADSNYKANRSETPDDFYPDLENLQQLLAALNFTTATVPGYEADDVIGTLAQQAADSNYSVKILSGDRDLFQLVDDRRNIEILYPDNKSIKGNQSYSYFDQEAVIDKLQVTPEQIVDYKALCGDKSDNIPGVKGVGEKTAVKLLTEYQTLDNIYQNLDNLKGAVKKKLETDKDNAFHSQFLAKIALDTPVDIDLGSCKIKGFDISEVSAILKKLELKKIGDRIKKVLLQNHTKTLTLSEETATGDDNKQLSLFEKKEPVETLTETTVAPQEEVIVQPEIITSNIQTRIIDTAEKLQELITILQQQTDINNPVAWDTETTSLEPQDAELVGIGCCWGEQADEVAYIPTKHTAGIQLEKSQVLAALKDILESDKYPKALQNAKFDRLVLQYQGIKLAGVVFDTMLASYLLNPDNSHNLTNLSERYGIEMIALSYKDLGIAKGETIANLDIETVGKYCGLDCYATYCLVPRIQADLDRYPKLNKLLKEVEQPLEIVLSKMESTGIALDVEYLNQFSEQLDADLQQIEQAVYTEAGEEFKLSSPKQLSVILFDKLGLNRKKSRKTKTGYSTNQAVLEKLKDDHAIIDRILEYRTLSKLKSTYVDALPALIRPDTQRVHTDFNQAVTATGRLSSSNPNLQNIPIRTEFSRQIRKAFIPKKDWLLVAADYSQIELRILAHLSQEPVLVDAYRNSLDVHSVTAQLLFEKEDITSEERRLGKIINFGVIYGMGAGRFSRESGLTTDVGREFINKYRQRYAKVFDYLESVKKLAVTQGFVTTILGRRRYFNFASRNLQKLQGENPDNINLDNIDYNYQDAQLLRAAANSTIQGSSADIIKIAMIKLHQILQQYQANLLLQVHDELVLEVPPNEWQELETKIKATMENSVSLSVPFVVEIHSGNNWMEAK